MTWNGNFGVQAWLESTFGHGFHDFCRFGRGPCHGRLDRVACRAAARHPPRTIYARWTDLRTPALEYSNITFLALGAWILTVGWLGFNVISTHLIEAISGLVAVNSLMAMVGGTFAALVAERNDPGFIRNGPIAGLVAICAGI
jgi:Amt family ammonium transporter